MILNYKNWRLRDMIKEGVDSSSMDPVVIDPSEMLVIIKNDIFVSYKDFMKHISKGGFGIVYWTQNSCQWCIKLNHEVLSTEYWQEWCELNKIKVLILRPESKDPDGIKDKIAANRGSDPLGGTPDLRLIKMTGTSGITQHAQGGYVPGGPKNWVNTFDYDSKTNIIN